MLAVFLRVHPNQSTLEWLSNFAAHAAVAIGNCRAFQQIDQLRRQLELERDYLREEVVETGDFRDIVGHSPALLRVLQQIDLVAQTDSSVSDPRRIRHRQGTHRARDSSAQPAGGKSAHSRELRSRFRRICSRVNSLGTSRDRSPARFATASAAFSSPTAERCFWTKWARFPLDLQSKLLRVLQEGEFERVGDERTRRVSVRVIAATNRDLRTESEQGRFRLDLFYRLSVFPLGLPSLRERREDIPHLASHFVKQACTRLHLPEAKIPQREMDRLQDYDWPGNVRELQNLVERAVILAQGAPLQFDLRGGRKDEATLAKRDREAFHTEAEWRDKEKENLLRR